MDEINKLEFHIITPFKGDTQLLDECRNSVRNQISSNHVTHHVIIDNDGKGACRNHFETLQKIKPDFNNIIIHLDGDDLFIGSNVISKLDKVYQNKNVWATYGNYVSRNKSVCRPMDGRGFRESIVLGGWPWSHLRTFRASLIPFLHEKDMKDSKNNWFTAAPDVAIFLPVLEMAGKDRVKFIDEDLVYYRVYDNNESGSDIKLKDQVRCALEIFNKPHYNRL